MHPVNPEAGAVPFPTDPAEVRLALRSSDVLWRAMPYFEARYGARGRRFGASDAGYLVAIAGLPEEVHRAQVIWLAGLLAARGMPSWALECHLRHLVARGEREGWSGAERTRTGLLALRERRQAEVDDRAFAEAAAEFARILGQERRRLATGLGMLTASAFVDARCGLCRSVDPFTGWVLSCEPAPGPFAEAVARVGELLGPSGAG